MQTIKLKELIAQLQVIEAQFPDKDCYIDDLEAGICFPHIKVQKLFNDSHQQLVTHSESYLISLNTTLKFYEDNSLESLWNNMNEEDKKHSGSFEEFVKTQQNCIDYYKKEKQLYEAANSQVFISWTE